MVLEGERLSYRTLDVERIGSVYETVMQQDSQEPFIQVRRTLRGHALDEGAIGGVQAPQQLVQRAEDLCGEAPGDLGLCLTTGV